MITRPPGVVALDVAEPALKENGLEASWPPAAIGVGVGAALDLFSPKVKLWLPGCGAGAVVEPKLNIPPPDDAGVDDVPPKLDVKFGPDAGWPPPKLKFTPPADGVFPPNMDGADVLGVPCWLPKLKPVELFEAGVEEV